MEKKLEEYLNHLSNSKKSKSSIKNYKADIKNFLLWRQENSPEKSLTLAFKNYKNYLLSIYSVNSVVRKTSSIKGFIGFAFPFEKLEESKSTSSRRNIAFLSSLTISLCLVTTIAIIFAFKQSDKANKVLGLTDSIRVNSNEEFSTIAKKQGLAIVVSAPQTDTQSGGTQMNNQFGYSQDNTINSVETEGNGKIEKGQNQTTIYAPLANKNSSIYLTPYSPDASLYIREVSDGYFIVGNNTDSEVVFKWMLKNIENNISIF